MPRLGAALRYTANRAHLAALQCGVRASALESTRLVASDRRGVVWDEGATVVDLPWQHIRFGRIYDAPALQRRVLTAGKGFATRVLHVTNAQAIHPHAGLFHALVMDKPALPARGWGLG